MPSRWFQYHDETFRKMASRLSTDGEVQEIPGNCPRVEQRSAEFIGPTWCGLTDINSPKVHRGSWALPGKRECGDFNAGVGKVVF